MTRHHKKLPSTVINPMTHLRKHISSRSPQYPLPRAPKHTYTKIRENLGIYVHSIQEYSRYLASSGALRLNAPPFRNDPLLTHRVTHLNPSLSAQEHYSLYFSKKRSNLFLRMTDPQLMHYFATIYLHLVYTNQIPQAELLLRNEFFLFHNWDAVLDLLRVYAHQGNLEKLEHLWMFYLEANRGRISEDYDVNGLYSSRNWMRKLGKEMRNLESIKKQRVDLMNCILHALMRRGENTKAQTLFSEWQEDGIEPNKETVLLMMTSYCMTRDPKTARQLCKQYFADKEDVEIVTALMHTYVVCGDPDNAKRVFLKYTLRNGDNPRTLVPNSSMVCKLIQGYAMCGRMKEAKKMFLKYFAEEESIFPVDAAVLQVMMYGYCRLGETEHAKRLLKEHVILGPVPVDIRMITSLIAGYAKTGQVREAVALYEEYCVPVEAPEPRRRRRRREEEIDFDWENDTEVEQRVYLAPTADTKIQLSSVMKYLPDLPEEEAKEIQEKLRDWL